MKILVTAAAGNQGVLLIPKLVAAGHTVRAARRNPDHDGLLKSLGATEVVTGDLYSPDAYTRALDGCDAVYHIGPTGSDREREGGFVMIDAAARCGTRHVVFSSVHQSIIDIVQHRYKRDIEERLYGSRLNYTVLKPCDFMLPGAYVHLVVKTGNLARMWKIDPLRRGSFVDLHDLTDVAAKVLNEGERHYHANYELVGPDKLTAQDIVTILSRVMGRPIGMVQSNPRKMIDDTFDIQAPSPEFKSHLLGIMESISAYYSNHDFIGNPNILEWLLGRPATSFEQFVVRELGRLKN